MCNGENVAKDMLEHNDSTDRLGTKSKCTYINELILKNNLLMEQDIAA
jgi:hypothetical protein